MLNRLRAGKIRYVAYVLACLLILALGLVVFLGRTSGGTGSVSKKLFDPCSAPCRYPIKGTNLGMVLDTYGAPAKVAAFVVPGDERYQILAVTLFFPTEGMTILASKKDANRIDQLTRDFEVDEVAFWKARTLEDMRIELEANRAPEAIQLSQWSQDWTGFGPVIKH
jgi:hypothetical protein